MSMKTSYKSLNHAITYSITSPLLYVPDPAFKFLQQRAAWRQTQARAQGTTQNRRSAAGGWLAFCHTMHIQPYRPTFQEVCAYLEYLAVRRLSPLTIRNILAHIRMHMIIAVGEAHNMYHPRVKLAMDALDRQKGVPSNVKDAIPLDLFRHVLLKIPYTQEGTILRAVLLLTFCAALRKSEVVPPSVKTFNKDKHLTRQDVVITQDTAQVTIKWAKNLQKFNQRKVVTLQSAQNPNYCPVRALTKVMSAREESPPNAPMFMFPGTCTPMPASYVNGEWERILQSLGVRKGVYTLHSLRSAAATAASTGGCTDSEVQRYGGWRSDAYKRYIRTNVDQKVNKVITNRLTDS